MTAEEANKLSKSFIPLEKRIHYVKTRITNVARRGRFSVEILHDDISDKAIFNALTNYDDTIPALEKEGYKVVRNEFKPGIFHVEKYTIKWGTDSIDSNLLNQ